MKILRISGRNLASLAGDFELDFEHGPLAKTHLYVITGPTGAGKSTLLDALCLALYDRTPRLQSPSSHQIPDSPETTLGVHDPRTLLRRGTSEGWAEVCFIGRDERRYRARWSVRRARNRVSGRLQASELSLHDDPTGVALGRTKLEVLAAIEAAVGLDFDQFRRSILLAQGDFAAFLKAKSDERSELLERMTGTALYSRISQRAHLKARQIEADLRAQEVEAQALPVLDEAVRTALRARVADLSAAVEHTACQLAALRVQQQWWTRMAELQHKHAEAQTRLQGCTEEWSAAAPRRAALAEIEAAWPLRSVVQEATRTSDAQAAAERQCQRADQAWTQAEAADQLAAHTLQQALTAWQQAREAAERARPEIESARALDHTLAAHSPRLQQLEQDCCAAAQRLAALAEDGAQQRAQRDALVATQTALQQWMDQHAVSVSLAQGWSEGIAPQLQAYVDTHARWRAEQDAWPALQTAVADARHAVAQAQHQHSTAAAAARAAQAQVQAAEAAEADFPQATQAARRVALEQARDALNALQQQHERALRVAQDLHATQADIAALEQSCTTAQAAAEAAASARQDVAEAQAATSRVLLQLGLQAHRNQLVDGEPCPLCGSIEHPGLGPIDTTLAVLEAEQRAQSARLAELQKVETTQHALLDTYATRLQALQVQLQLNQHAYQTARADWYALGGVGDPGDALALETLHTRTQGLHAEAQALSALEHTLQQLRDAARAARNAQSLAAEDLTQALQALQQAERAAGAAQQHAQNAEHALHAARQMLDHTQHTLAPAYAAVQGWQQALEADPAAFLHSWTAQVEYARAQTQALDQAHRGLAELDARLGVHASELQQATQHHDALLRDLRQQRAQHDHLHSQRSALLQGRPVAQVEAEAHTTLRQREHAHAQAVEQACHASAERARTHEAQRIARHTLDQAIAAHTQAALALDAALAQAGIDAATLHARLAHDEAWLQAERTALNALAQAQVSVAQAVQDRAQDLADHTRQPAPPLPAAEIAAQLAEREPQHRALAEQLGAAAQQLAQDDQHRATGAERAAALAEARAAAQVWLQLDQLIGSADGRKFRIFAQSLTLERLLAHANAELASLAPRYQLQRVPSQDLDLQVIDRDMGDDIRSTASLSGGETFLVSLALALGLSALAADQVRIESLFIDEGFGTLDPHTLETALATLDALQSTGRKVGLISHVPGLAERIGVQVRVERQGQGGSGVRVG